MRVLAFDIGVKNLAYCIMQEDGVEKWDIFDVSGKDFNETSKNLIAMLHDEFPDSDFASVLIENQPVMKNPIMKSIQMLIYSYFLISVHQTGSNCDVRLVSPACKLRVKRNDNPKVKLSYKEKKTTAIQLAQKYLTNPIWLERLRAHKKKDDISDALLYCVSYLETKGVLRV